MPDKDVDQADILAALDRLNRQISAKDLAFLDEFAPVADIMLVGSEPAEIAKGRDAIEALVRRLFDQPVTLSWEWSTRSASVSGMLPWIFAEGEAVVAGANGTKRLPYRLSGVLEKYGAAWRWRLFHGSEPSGPAHPAG